MAGLVTKKGEAVPTELAAPILGDTRLHALWDKARPSCQARYAAHVDDAKKPETRQRRVEAMLKQMAETYGPKI